MLRFAAINKMKFAPHNALRGLKKSQVLVIVYRHVAGVQRNSFTSLRIRTTRRTAKSLQPVQSTALGTKKGSRVFRRRMRDEDSRGADGNYSIRELVTTPDPVSAARVPSICTRVGSVRAAAICDCVERLCVCRSKLLERFDHRGKIGVRILLGERLDGLQRVADNHGAACRAGLARWLSGARLPALPRSSISASVSTALALPWCARPTAAL